MSSETCPLLFSWFGLCLSHFESKMMPSYRISLGLTVEDGALIGFHTSVPS